MNANHLLRFHPTEDSSDNGIKILSTVGSYMIHNVDETNPNSRASEIEPNDFQRTIVCNPP